jgi:thiamine pyrophosphokinase
LVDGGANIFHSLQAGFTEKSISKVKALIGDLDSVEPEVEQFYKYRNVKIVKDLGQEKNDF